MILADKIIMLRKQSGWSQEELAEKLGVSRQSVSKWESGMSMPDMDKILKLSNVFSVSTDYLLKDDIEQIELCATQEEEVETGRIVSVEEANAYMEECEQASGKYAFATFLCVISPICLLLFGCMAEAGILFPTEDLAGGIGIIVLLPIVAIGVGIFITTGMQLDKYEYIGKEKITLAYGVEGIVQKKKEGYAPIYRKSVVFCTVLCILSVMPLMIAGGFGASDLVCAICLDILIFFVAIGASYVVKTSTIQECYEKLLQEKDYAPHKKANKRSDPFSGAYWCIVTAAYVGVSFYTYRWDMTWIIWPVAALIYAGLKSMLDAIVEKEGA